MDKLKKLFVHLKNGTLISRIIDHHNIEIEKKWRNFGKKSDDYIYKKLYKNYRIKLYKNSLLSKSIYLEKYEADELYFLKLLLTKGDVFIDIGANIGLFSIIGSKRVGNKGKIYSCEPGNRAYTNLCENLSLNKISNVIPNKLGISNKNEVLNLNSEGDGLEALFSFGFHNEIKSKYESVDCITLDSFVERNEIKKIKAIKIDVEGWEYKVIEGSIKTLKKFMPILIIEFNDENANRINCRCFDIYKLLIDLGYKIYTFEGKSKVLKPSPVQEKYTYINLIAVSDFESLSSEIKVIDE